MELKATNVFQRNYEAFFRDDIVYIKNEGGSRSSKTYSITQLLIIWALKNPNKIISVIRKHTTTVKNTIMKQDFIPMLKDMGLYKKDSFNMTDATYTFDNGTIIEFYGADDDQKLHGRRRDVAWLNEATELLWDDFKQIAMRTTGKIIIDYNPTAPTSFLYELPEEKTVKIHSTYHDNPFLTKTQMDFIEDLKRTDPTGYQIYALGKRGIAKENVYKLWNRVKEKPVYLKNFIYGIDFGFSHDTALVKIWYDTDTMKVFIEEMIYAPKMTSGDIVEEMDRLGIDKDISIVADYARPEIIHDMRMSGYTVIEADKSVKAGINSVRQFDICICENALNIKKENELYKYKKVGDVITEDPIKKYDDAMDAIRYALHYVKTYECGGGDIEVWTFDLG
jgi:phage terminase large subunit